MEKQTLGEIVSQKLLEMIQKDGYCLLYTSDAADE